MAGPVVTLLTDFGATDTYAATVKGVILSINPNVTLVDLTHQAPPQDVGSAAFLLGTAAPHFPRGTIHVAVVDPGVGTERRPLLLMTRNAAFVGPDNGIFTYVLDRDPFLSGSEAPPEHPYEAPLPEGVQGYHLTNARFWRHPVSQTFHARDIFGPVAAHLTLGVAPEELGEPVTSVLHLPLPEVRRSGNVLEGQIIHVDPFGNLITNIAEEQVRDQRATVHIAGRTIPTLSATYARGDGLLALVGSHGLVEVALRDGSAAQALGVGIGEGVRVELES